MSEILRNYFVKNAMIDDKIDSLAVVGSISYAAYDIIKYSSKPVMSSRFPSSNVPNKEVLSKIMIRSHPNKFCIRILPDNGRNSFLFLFSSHLGSTIVIFRGP